jgi:hypothetical protein
MFIFIRRYSMKGDRGSTVVKVLCYKSEGRWFYSRWCHWKFPLTQSFRLHYGPGFDSASNRNEYQEYLLGVNAAGAWGCQTYPHTVSSSRNNGTFFEISGPLQACNGVLYPENEMNQLFMNYICSRHAGQFVFSHNGKIYF